MASIGLRDGKWQARVRLAGFPKVCRSFIKKADAQKWARGVESDMQGGRWQPEREVFHGIETFDDLLRVYLDEVTPTKRGRVQEANLIRLMRAAPECKALRSRRVDQVQPADFAALRDHWLSRGLSAATVRIRLCLFSHCLVTARREFGMLHVENAVKDINKPRAENGRARVITDDEARRIASAARHAELPDFLTLALSTAMRRGEIASLRWENIDLDRRVAFLPLTKSGRSATIALDAQALAVLKRMPRREDGRVFGMTANSASIEFVWAVRTARGLYRHECAALGMPIDTTMLSDVTLHDARHTALTSRAAQGWSVMELLALSRHASGVRLLQRYVHLSPDHLLKRFDEGDARTTGNMTSVRPALAATATPAIAG